MRAMIMCSALFAALSLLAPFEARADTWDDCRGADTEKAVAACTKLIDRGRLNQTERATAYQFRAAARNATKNFEAAIADLDRVLELQPQNATAYVTRSIALKDIGKLENALSDLNRAIELKEDYPEAWHVRGWINRMLGSFDEAIADASHALRLKKDYPAAYVNRGWAYYEKRELESAMADLDIVIAADPNYPAAYTLRGLVYESLGEQARATAEFHSAIAVPLDSNTSSDSWGHETASRRLEAIKLGEQGAEWAGTPGTPTILPGITPGPNNRGSCGLSISADSDWAECTSSSPVHALGGCRALINAPDLQPQCLAAAHFYRGTAYAKVAKYDEAISDFSETVALDWFHAGAYANRGLAFEATGASASATNDYKIVLAISADAPLARAAQLRARERMRSLTSGKLAPVRSQDFITDFRKPPIKGLPRDDTIGSDGTLGAPPPGGLPESPEVIAPEPVKEPHEVVKVFYATDRKRTESTAPNETFGSERGELTLGVCEVSIPKSHVEGQMEGPNPFALEFREDPERHVVLLKVTDLSKDSFMNELKARVGASSGRKAFLFVHGFNVSFKDAARRTAQLHKDLAFDGAPVFYSWPSQASVLSYTVDSTNAEWSVATLKGFLEDFVAGSDAQQVFLIAHSMGTQLLTAALAQVLAEDPSMGTKLTAIVLAAPDIDADVFRRDLAPRFAATGTNVVLYASNSDQALSLSRQVHGYRRAGDSSDGALIVEGIDTIEASGIDTSLLGHSYYGSIKTVLSDIGGVLTTGSRAEKRTGLKPVSGYWQFVGPPEQ